MDFDAVTRRMDNLKAIFDPHNPEHIAELMAIWELMRPTVEAVAEWWNSLPDIAKTAELKPKMEAFSHN